MKYYENFLGFRFGEYHSRDLGLYRVSDGDRYNDVSIPTFSDTTSKIPGGDGTYYWDSFYNQRTFTINTAFDNLSETQLRQIRQIFNGKAEDWLIFDEVPYKKYRVKVQSPPQIKYHSFREDPVYDEEQNRTFERPRVYKGEIVFQFVSYYPYGIDNFKTVPFNLKRLEPVETVNCYTFTATRSIYVLDTLTATSTTIPSGAAFGVPTDYIVPLRKYTVPNTTHILEDIQELNLIYERNKYVLGSNGHALCDATLYIGATSGDRTVELSTSTVFTNKANIQGPESRSNYTYSTGEKYVDKWIKLDQLDEFKYQKNPWHYYIKQGNLYISNTAYSSTASYFTPDLKTDEEVQNSYKNALEWWDSAQLLSDIRYEALRKAGDQEIGAGYFIYNPGDLPTDVRIIIKSTVLTNNGLDVILKRKTEDRASEEIIEELYLSLIPENVLSEDIYIIIDSAKNLVYGANAEKEPTGNLYNKYITSGTFFKLPVTQSPILNHQEDEEIIPGDTRLVDYCDYLWINIQKTDDIELEYNYLYY